jgi:cyclopropane fatty-acyl-phospholipid synthase-like methyltransferase
MRPSRAPDAEKLVSSWLPSLEGVVAKLERGAKVAEVGCGGGASAVRMAQAFPKSRFFGYDAHPESIAFARQQAAAAGLSERVTFDVASATDLPGREYDLVCHVGGLQYAENPASAARRVKDVLAAGGTWMIVELGGQAAEARLRRVATEAGFASVLRAAETPFDVVIEARL